MQEWQWPSRGKESVQAAYSGKDVYLQLKKKNVEHRLHKENTDYDSQDEVRQKKKTAFFLIKEDLITVNQEKRHKQTTTKKEEVVLSRKANK